MKPSIKLSKGKTILSQFILLICGACLVSSVEAALIENNQVGQVASKKMSEMQEELVLEATQAIELTEKALGQLEKEHYKKSITTLENALGKIEVINADNSGNGNILIDLKFAVFDLTESNQFIKNEKAKAQKELKKGSLQKAKEILDPLASEIIIESYSIALSSYPSFIKESIKAIKDKDYDAATISLISALSSVEIEQVVLPLPILRAYSAIESLELDLKTTKLDLKDAGVKLGLAKDQLLRAELLGYELSNVELKDLQNKINLAEKEIKKNQKPVKILAKLRDSLRKIKDKVVN